jgi:hypothetical protein
MPYLILRDSFGNGLELCPSAGLTIFTREQLPEALCSVAHEILSINDCDTLPEYHDCSPMPIGEEIVVCEILGEMGDKEISDFIHDILVEDETKRTQEEYQLYLKLKRKFDGR